MHGHQFGHNMSITFVANYPEFPYFLWKSRARSNPSIETNIAMIPRFGIMGAVQATTISYSAACLVLLTAFYFEARICRSKFLCRSARISSTSSTSFAGSSKADAS